MENKRFGFLGVTKYSKEMLQFLISEGFIPEILFYISLTYKI